MRAGCAARDAPRRAPSFRLHPLTDLDADELIGSVKASKLLQGYRGSAPGDIPALHVSQVVKDLPEIVEIDINPVIVRESGQGAFALDARIRLSRLDQ